MKKVKILDAETVKRKWPKNLKVDDKKYFSHETKRTFPQYYMIKIDKCIISDTLLIKKDRLRVLIYNHRLFRRKLFYYLISVFRRIKNKKLDNNTCYCWIVDDWSGSYFHWFCDVFPKLILIKQKNIECKVLIPEKFRKRKFIQESLKKIDVDFVTFSGDHKLNKLFYFPNLAPSGNYRPSFIKEIRKILTKTYNRIPFRKLYISREKTGYRKVTNEKEVSDFLRKRGFEIYYFEQLTLDEQIRLASESKITISPHGAGLTNMLFMTKGTKVIEFRRKGDTHSNCYFALADALDLEYYYILCESKNQKHNANLTVNLKDLEEVLAKANGDV